MLVLNSENGMSWFALISSTLLSTSSRFISSFASIVQAASCGGSSDASGFDSPTAMSCLASSACGLIVGQQVGERRLHDRQLLGAERAGEQAAGEEVDAARGIVAARRSP